MFLIGIGFFVLLRFQFAWHTHFAEGVRAPNKGQFDLAARKLRDAERILTKSSVPSPALALCSYALGEVYRQQSRLEEAESLMRSSLAMRLGQWGPDHSQTLQSTVGVANVCLALGRYEEAELLLQRALAITEKLRGTNHTDVGVCLNNLGKSFADRDDFVQAETYFRRALVICERKRTSPVHAMVINNVAHACVHQGKADEAEHLARQALEKFERKCGPNHAWTAIALTTLARCLRLQNRLSEADEAANRGLEIRQRQLDPDRPNIADSFECLGEIAESMRNVSEAKKVYLRALAIREQALPPGHSDTEELRKKYDAIMQRFEDSSVPPTEVAANPQAIRIDKID
jgi:tetratricopeptide (TPR) repeat protein